MTALQSLETSTWHNNLEDSKRHKNHRHSQSASSPLSGIISSYCSMLFGMLGLVAEQVNVAVMFHVGDVHRYLHAFLTSTLERNDKAASRADRFTTREITMVTTE